MEGNLIVDIIPHQFELSKTIISEKEDNDIIVNLSRLRGILLLTIGN